jgi:ATP-grasp domain
MTSQAVAGHSYALLADGTTVEIRPAGPDDTGAVSGPAEVRRALGRLPGRFGDRLPGVRVQAMISGGTETIIGVVQGPVLGPLVVSGLGGIATGCRPGRKDAQ